ncbi:MAG: META domain-containing protein [Methylocystis sp.]|nr:META domain-containing protein [Methylocystis sp.]
MNKVFVGLVAALGAFSLAAAPAQAKKRAAKPAENSEQQQAEENKDTGGIPRYQPFPHNQNFVLQEINGKKPPVEMWISIDATGRANGFSGCKNWSGVFAIGPDRLGPRSMPAINDHKCEGAIAGFERDYWGILMTGPYWDTKGDELIIKAAKGAGQMRFQRSL